MAQFHPVGELCAALGATTVEVFFGWGAPAQEETWKPNRIAPTDLPAFAQRGVEIGVYRPGESEVVIGHTGGDFELRFCHEADLHFEASDSELIEEVREAWTYLGLDPRWVRR